MNLNPCNENAKGLSTDKKKGEKNRVHNELVRLCIYKEFCEKGHR